MERKIWRFYIYQIIFRTAVDFAFLTVQWHVYPYRQKKSCFIFLKDFFKIYRSGNFRVFDRSLPLSSQLLHFPTDRKVQSNLIQYFTKFRTIFFNYKYIIGLITCIINFLEIWYIGWIRIRFDFRNYFQNDRFLRRAFQEDPSPPYFGMNVIEIRIFCIKYIFRVQILRKTFKAKKNKILQFL